MWFPHRVTVKRFTIAEVDGEDVPTSADAATGQKCRIEATPGRMTITQTGFAVDYDAMAFFPRKADIRPGADDTQPDEIVVTKPATSERYRVMGVGDEAGTDHHLTAFLKRVGQG